MVEFCSPISSAIDMYLKESSQVLLCNNVEKNIFSSSGGDEWSFQYIYHR